MNSGPAFIVRGRVNHTGLAKQSLECDLERPDFARVRTAVEDILFIPTMGAGQGGYH